MSRSALVLWFYRQVTGDHGDHGFSLCLRLLSTPSVRFLCFRSHVIRATQRLILVRRIRKCLHSIHLARPLFIPNSEQHSFVLVFSS